METMVQRLIGICQICEGQFKLDQNAMMVHHGYKRPGRGYIVGDCQAVGHPAYEQSCELIKSYVAVLRKSALPQAQERLRQLEAGEVLELHVSRLSYRTNLPETRTYKVGEQDFDRVLRSQISEQRQTVEWLERDIQRCDKRIADWKPLPIRTIEEVADQQRANKEAAQQARDAKKAARLAEKIAGYQKRIDTAVRRHTSSTIADIFESAPSKLRDIAAGSKKLTRAEALALLQRDHVWKAFGLNVQDDRSEANRAILGKMQWPGIHGMKQYPWPEGLEAEAKRDAE